MPEPILTSQHRAKSKNTDAEPRSPNSALSSDRTATRDELGQALPLSIPAGTRRFPPPTLIARRRVRRRRVITIAVNAVLQRYPQQSPVALAPQCQSRGRFSRGQARTACRQTRSFYRRLVPTASSCGKCITDLPSVINADDTLTARGMIMMRLRIFPAVRIAGGELVVASVVLVHDCFMKVIVSRAWKRQALVLRALTRRRDSGADVVVVEDTSLIVCKK